MAKLSRNSVLKLGAALVITVVAAVFLLLAPHLSALHRFELTSWDIRQRMAANPALADRKIKLIVIDQPSIDYFAKQEQITWPWPRPLYIPIIKFLERAGAKVLVFDLLFTESAVQGVEDDLQFAKSIGSNLKVVHAAALSADAQALDGDFERFRRKQSAAAAALAGLKLKDFPGVTLPIREILDSPALIASANADPDDDGIFRHYRLASSVRGVPIVGLPVAAFQAYTGANLPQQLSAQSDGSGEVTLRFHGPSATYSSDGAARVILSELALERGEKALVDPKLFKDSVVFLGVWAPGLLDLRPTPLDDVFRGVEYNATVLDNLLHDDFVRRSSTASEFLVALTAVLAALGVSLFVSSWLWQALGLGAVLAIYLGVAVGLAFGGVWMGIVPGFAATLFAAISGFAIQYQLEGRHSRFLRHAFAHYLSPEVIEQVVRDPSALKLGGEKRELSIFFSDLAGFTAISEKLDAAALVKLLNIFLGAMTEEVLTRDGTLDKYQGDAVIAFWNAPLSVPDHALKSVEAALACQRRLRELRPSLTQEFKVDLRMRIGINSGAVSVGNFGSRERFNYTMLGDAANLASRLEGANKYFGSEIMISEETYLRLNGAIACRKLGQVRVKGREAAVAVYEPLDGKLSAEELREFSAALAKYEQGEWEGALRTFQTLEQDPVARAYCARIKAANLEKTRSAVWELEGK